MSVEVSSPVHPTERAEIERRVTWIPGLDQDLWDFYSLAKEEPKLAASVRQAAGCILRSSTIFEDIVKTILTTNTLWYGGAPVGSAEVEAAFDRWGKWKGLAYWLWEWSSQG